MSLPNSELTASVPDPKNAILGTKMTPRWSIFQDFSSGRCPEVPPGAPGRPRGELDCIYCSGLHTIPPGTLWITLSGSTPAPGPGEATLYYYFLPPSLYLLRSTMCLLVDPHAAALRGRRICKSSLPGAGGRGWGVEGDPQGPGGKCAIRCSICSPTRFRGSRERIWVLPGALLGLSG